ncbi:hypothetical protein RclHR1_00070002 [Rhizophagus clarus]|uniref:Uncharacterized protein n=1 Tax=Rhizophagus clarus TaxID=94130 RepID=A0A2Z6S703_9GLOM|nr:hypothetical protein RclHR1_00070002 [Rhizophagus clarus]
MGLQIIIIVIIPQSWRHLTSGPRMQFPPLSLKTSLTSGLVQRQTKDPFVDRIKFTIIISKKNSKTRVCRSNQTCQSNDPSSRRRLNLWAKWCDVVANSIL